MLHQVTIISSSWLKFANYVDKFHQLLCTEGMTGLVKFLGHSNCFFVDLFACCFTVVPATQPTPMHLPQMSVVGHGIVSDSHHRMKRNYELSSRILPLPPK